MSIVSSTNFFFLYQPNAIISFPPFTTESSTSREPWLAYPHSYYGRDDCIPSSKPLRLKMTIQPKTPTPIYAFRSVSKSIRHLLFIHGNAQWFSVAYSSHHINQKMRFCLSKASDLPQVSGCYLPFYSSLSEPLCPKGEISPFLRLLSVIESSDQVAISLK